MKRYALAALAALSCHAAQAGEPFSAPGDEFGVPSTTALYRVEFGGARDVATTHRLALSSGATAQDVGRPLVEYRWSGEQTRLDLGGVPVRLNGQPVLNAGGGAGTLFGLSKLATYALVLGTMTTLIAVTQNIESDGAGGISGNGGGVTGNGSTGNQ